MSAASGNTILNQTFAKYAGVYIVAVKFFLCYVIGEMMCDVGYPSSFYATCSQWRNEHLIVAIEVVFSIQKVSDYANFSALVPCRRESLEMGLVHTPNVSCLFHFNL